MKLAIISHTRHYYTAQGILKGWGPTVREINFLSDKFQEIIHLGCLHPGEPPPSALEYEGTNLKFIALPPSGGPGWNGKVSSMTTAREVIRKVSETIGKVDAVQLRVPTGMANYLLPYLTFRKNKPLIWVKYAGNWGQLNPPISYGFQRWWLNNNFLKCKVSINGAWPLQPYHCLTFENPCLDELERKEGWDTIQQKKYSGPYTACFIGRIEAPKGVARILSALPAMAKNNINTIHFIGDGNELAEYSKLASENAQVKCIFHGSVSRIEISNFLKASHFLLLPSTASEGFPKVIAEGANYGAIPIVSDVSGITQYVNKDNGFVWNTKTGFTEWVEKLIFDPEDLSVKSQEAYKMAAAFTFEQYYQNLTGKILP